MRPTVWQIYMDSTANENVAMRRMVQGGPRIFRPGLGLCGDSLGGRSRITDAYEVGSIGHRLRGGVCLLLQVAVDQKLLWASLQFNLNQSASSCGRCQARVKHMRLLPLRDAWAE